MYIQFGGFNEAPHGWYNYEPSVYLRLFRLPVIGKLLAQHKGFDFPREVIRGDIVKGLPVPEDSVNGVYSSHVLEHLSLVDCRKALYNVYKMLGKGGVFRFVVPDLYTRVEYYLNNYEEMAEPASWLMNATLLGSDKVRPNGFTSFARAVYSTSAHKWMWDFKSIQAELKGIGFSEVRRVKYGESNDPMFLRVERRERFFWSPSAGGGQDAESVEYEELAVEAVK